MLIYERTLNIDFNLAATFYRSTACESAKDFSYE